MSASRYGPPPSTAGSLSSFNITTDTGVTVGDSIGNTSRGGGYRNLQR